MEIDGDPGREDRTEAGMNEERVSKSQRKREAQDVQKLGEELVELPTGVLDGFSLEPEVREAIDEARKIKSHSARRRQMQRIGALMRDVDCAPIRAHLQRWKEGRHAVNEELHQVQVWRDAIVAGDDGPFDTVIAAVPSINAKRLRQLAQAAREERAEGRPPRHFRELYQFIRGAMQQAHAGTEHSVEGGEEE